MNEQTEKKSIPVHQVTLSTGKVVLMRPMKISVHKNAIKVAGSKGTSNQALLAVEVQEEILKQLIVQIDGKEPSKVEIEKLDELFDYAEFGQLVKFLDQMTGGQEMGNFTTAIVNI